jgi:peptide/nickel transport system substrate-binding protein
VFKAHKRLFIAAVALAGVVSLTACGSDDADAGTGSTQPRQGGTLTRISQGDPAGFDPADTLLTPSTYSHDVLPIYDLLVRVDAEGRVTPRLAESVTSDDNKTWVVKLRPNVKFSDGTPFNAAAVKQNFDRYRKPEANQTAAMHNATAIEVVDDTTVKVVLKDGDAHFPRVLMGQAGMIVAPATLQAWAANQNPLPIGAGPFVLKEHVPNTRFTYERNPNYWDSPRPYVDKLVINVITDANQGFNAFRAEEADIVSYVPGPPQEWQDLRDSDYKIVESTQIGGNAYLYQNQKAPTDDVRVRRALSLAADLGNANEQAAEGAETMADTLFPEGSPFHNDGLKQQTNDLATAQ